MSADLFSDGRSQTILKKHDKHRLEHVNTLKHITASEEHEAI